jgi:hypothetical protein
MHMRGTLDHVLTNSGPDPCRPGNVKFQRPEYYATAVANTIAIFLRKLWCDVTDYSDCDDLINEAISV